MAPTSPEHDTAWLLALSNTSTPEAQLSLLAAAGLDNEAGLARLLESAMQLARRDPGSAQRLTRLCAELASRVGAEGLVPRAIYLQAQTYAINGDFATAQRLIEKARLSYEAQGNEFEALRTNVGLMHILNELGHHEVAIEEGTTTLTLLAALPRGSEELTQRTLLTALVNQNLGVCYETVGRYTVALEAYAAAEAALTALGMRERLGDISNNRGIVLVHLGRVSEALEAFNAAAAIRAEAGLTLLQAQTLSNIGEAYLAAGEYTRSLSAFEEAEQLLATLDAQAHYHILKRKSADAYRVLNLYPEALGAYQTAAGALAEAGMADHHARALWGLGSTLLALARPQEAAPALAEAAMLFGSAGNIPMLCSVKLEEAALHQAQGELERAREITREVLALLDGESFPVERLYATMRLADLQMPDVAQVEPLLMAANAIAATLPLPQVAYRLSWRFGRLWETRGEQTQACEAYEAAIDIIERLRGTLAQEALRTSFLHDKSDVYSSLLALHLEDRDATGPAKAFATAERAKSRTLVDLLTGVIAAPGLPADSPSAKRVQQLQADLNATYNQFLSPTEGVALPELQARAATLEQEISRLRRGARGSVADPFVVPMALDQLPSRFPDDLPVLAYHILGDEILAFLVYRGSLQVFRHLSDLDIIQSLLQRLAIQWDRFRAGTEFAERHLAVLLTSTQRILAALYQALLAPLAGALEAALPHERDEAGQLAIVPHGLLHQVPFHALFDGERAMLERWEISYAPSAAVLALCQTRARRPRQRGLVIGVADPSIPEVATEVAAVTQQLRDAGMEVQPLLNAEATLDTVQALASQADLLHIACHGLFRHDNPIFSALRLHDGWLTAADVMSLDLSGATVALSACESGRSQVLQGDEAIGLARAYLGAGATSLVVTLWLVQDETTAVLMADWYQQLGNGLSPVKALRTAQLALKARHPHPYYWAPFMLVGKRDS